MLYLNRNKMEETKKICNALADLPKTEMDSTKNKQLIKLLKQNPNNLPVMMWCDGKMRKIEDCLVCTNTGRDGKAYIVICDRFINIPEGDTFIEAVDEDGHI